MNCDPVAGDNLCQANVAVLSEIISKIKYGIPLSEREVEFISYAYLLTNFTRKASQRPRFVDPGMFITNLRALNLEVPSKTKAKKKIRWVRQELMRLQKEMLSLCRGYSEEQLSENFHDFFSVTVRALAFLKRLPVSPIFKVTMRRNGEVVKRDFFIFRGAGRSYITLWRGASGDPLFPEGCPIVSIEAELIGPDVDLKFEKFKLLNLESLILEQAALHPSFAGKEEIIFNHQKHQAYYCKALKNGVHRIIVIRHFSLEQPPEVIKRLPYEGLTFCEQVFSRGKDGVEYKSIDFGSHNKSKRRVVYGDWITFLGYNGQELFGGEVYWVFSKKLHELFSTKNDREFKAHVMEHILFRVDLDSRKVVEWLSYREKKSYPLKTQGKMDFIVNYNQSASLGGVGIPPTYGVAFKDEHWFQFPVEFHDEIFALANELRKEQKPKLREKLRGSISDLL